MRVTGRSVRRLVVAATLLSALCARGAAVRGQTVVPVQQLARDLSVRELVLHAGTVSGVLQNNSPRLLRDVRVVVHYTWMWKNERHPGDDNPGRSEYYTLPGEAPAGGSLRFSVRPDPPLPARADGRFALSADVVSFTEVGQ